MTGPTQAELKPLRRLTALRSILLSLQNEYLIAEGPTRRGKHFDSLVSVLDQFGCNEPPLTEIEVLAWLGPPDFGDSDERGAQYYYLYDRFGSKDWFASLTLDHNGVLNRIGWNEATELHPETMLPYHLFRMADGGAHKPLAPGRGYLGVRTERVSWSDDGHTYIGTYGVQVTSIAPDSPASHVGLQIGDRITRINGERFDATEFVQRISQLQPGQSATVTVLRNPQASTAADEKEIQVTIGSPPQAP